MNELGWADRGVIERQVGEEWDVKIITNHAVILTDTTCSWMYTAYSYTHWRGYITLGFDVPIGVDRSKTSRWQFASLTPLTVGILSGREVVRKTNGLTNAR